MQRRLKVLPGVVLALVGFGIGACGDDSDGGGGGGSNAYADAIATGLGEQDDLTVTGEQAECLSEELVEAVGGPEVFEDAGLSPEDVAADADPDFEALAIDESRIDAISGIFATCDVSLKDDFLATFDDAPGDVATCVGDAIDDDTLSRLFAEGLVGSDTEVPAELTAAITECASAEG